MQNRKISIVTNSVVLEHNFAESQIYSEIKVHFSQLILADPRL